MIENADRAFPASSPLACDGDAGALTRDEQSKILVLQQKILHAVATGVDTIQIINEVCSLEERLVPNSLGSVMLLDEDRELLNVFAAPSCPPEGIVRLNGLRPGPGGGLAAMPSIAANLSLFKIPTPIPGGRICDSWRWILA